MALTTFREGPTTRRDASVGGGGGGCRESLLDNRPAQAYYGGVRSNHMAKTMVKMVGDPCFTTYGTGAWMEQVGYALEIARFHRAEGAVISLRRTPAWVEIKVAYSSGEKHEVVVFRPWSEALWVRAAGQGWYEESCCSRCGELWRGTVHACPDDYDRIPYDREQARIVRAALAGGVC